MKKLCSKCGIERELSCFYRHEETADGLRPECKECCRKYHQAYWKSKKGKETLQKYRQSNAGKETQRKADQKRRLLSPQKIKARRIVSHAIRDGKLIRPSHCESCSKKRFVEAHHKDYSKPLVVNWLCKECHKEWDAFFWEEGTRKGNFNFGRIDYE